MIRVEISRQKSIFFVKQLPTHHSFLSVFTAVVFPIVFLTNDPDLARMLRAIRFTS